MLGHRTKNQQMFHIISGKIIVHVAGHTQQNTSEIPYR